MNAFWTLVSRKPLESTNSIHLFFGVEVKTFDIHNVMAGSRDTILRDLDLAMCSSLVLRPHPTSSNENFGRVQEICQS